MTPKEKEEFKQLKRDYLIDGFITLFCFLLLIGFIIYNDKLIDENTQLKEEIKLQKDILNNCLIKFNVTKNSYLVMVDDTFYNEPLKLNENDEVFVVLKNCEVLK